ncbi:MAG: M24 family metallopeptidase [Anaerolineales bacterium]|jgi:antitoxin VapB
MSIPHEAQEKERRIRTALSELGRDSLIITRRDNFAWLSCGGLAVVSHVVPTSPVFLVVTPQKKYAVGYTMDLPRTMDEELTGQGYEPVFLPTFGKPLAEVALELAKGKVAADDVLAGVENVGARVVALHEPYTPEEMDRYRAIAKESGEILHELAEWVEPGMTERKVFAHMWGAYLERGFEGNCMFVGSDERIRRYRHPVPSDKPIQKAVLLAPGISKAGLHVLNSRMVYFEEPPADIRRRYRAVATMQAAMVTATRPGAKLSSLLDLCLGLFETVGYPEERTNHVHGGPTGYQVSYPERCQDPQAVVTPNMAFAWYMTVAGTKSEELLLVDEEGARIHSVDPTWPTLPIEYHGSSVPVPDILVRSKEPHP